MSKRRAVLIGVSEYESDAIPDLPIVHRDLEIFHTALEKSGFTVNSIGANGLQQTGRSKILQALRRACKDAQADETLILYFSGHGIHYKGKDFLVPSDAVFDDAEAIEEYLVSTDISDVVDQSKAKTIIFFIDACREGVKLGIKDTQLINWSRGERAQVKRRGFVTVFACGAGQVSQYISGETGFSLFTSALAETFDPQCSDCTLLDVLNGTQTRLNTLLFEHKKQPQQVHYAYEYLVEDDILSRVICDGLVASNYKGIILDRWSETVLQSPLWKKDEINDNFVVNHLKKQAVEIVAACWRQWQTAKVAFPEDMWRDEELPIRVLEVLELLVFRSNPPIELDNAETSVAIVVPFIREAVLASAMIHATKVAGLSLEKTDIEHPLRHILDKNFQTQLRFIRKAQRLQEQGQLSNKDAVMTWMIYQCLLKTLETWQPESSGGFIANSFIQVLDNTNFYHSRLVSESLSRQRLLELAYCMFADFERIDRDDRPNALQSKVAVGDYHEEKYIREKLLAYLLKLAGALAIDVRILSDVLVDHIGLADPLTPEQIRQTITQIRWIPSGQGRVLSVTCNHPAIDLSLREHIKQAGMVLAHILRQVEDSRTKMEALKGLPTHLLPDRIVAEKKGDTPVYQTPHVNFQIAHDEIRELLMGEQLYGDPTLAIRELYQNALDACRYRQARSQYLKQTEHSKGINVTWEGHIIFRQTVDNDGRPYIECEDNGIGMGMQHLESCFARAGRRFAELPEFVEEQAEWLKNSPPIQLYPNSQFGIGVLSYFMLADEIEVETCRLDREGHPGERLQVRIPGSSGLFRVQQLGKGQEAGTRVRLYLNQTRYKRQLISCIETLRKLLWVAEFRTEANHFGRQEVWKPGKLKHPDYPEEFCLEIPTTDIWWVPEIYYWQKAGCILSDGIWTRESKPGFVFNLHGNFLPKLTVDRKDILEYNQAEVTKKLIQNFESVLNWQGLDLELLWKLAKENPCLAENIVQGIKTKKSIIPLKAWGYDSFEIPIHKVGCFEPDYHIIESKYGISIPKLIEYHIPYWLIPNRLLIWQEIGLFNFFSPCMESIPPLMRSEFWPELQAGDSIILNEAFPPERYLTHCINEYIPPTHMIHAAIKLDESLSKTFRRFQKFVPLGLEIPQVDIDALETISITDEDIIAVSWFIRTGDDLSFSSKRNEQWKIPWPTDEISVGQILITSVRLNEPIAESITRFQKFAPLGLKITNIDTEQIPQLNVTPEDVIALSIRLNGEAARIRNKVSPIDIASIAKRLNEPITNTIIRLQRLSILGLKLPEMDIDFLTNYRLEHDNVVAQKIIEREVGGLDEYVSVAEIVSIAGQLHEPIGSTVLRLQKFLPLGLKLPNIDFIKIQNLTVEREDITIFSELDYSYYGAGESSWTANKVTSAHLIKAANNLNESVENILHRFHKFIPLGLEVPEFDVTSLNELVKSEEDLIAVSKTLTRDLKSSLNLLQGRVHPTRIILAALALKEPIPTTFARFQRFAPVLGLKLPEGEPNSWHFSNNYR